MNLIGREYEKRKLENAFNSDRSEFVAVYGRRRVGKTFLIRELLGDRFVFSYAGKANLKKAMQLVSFRESLILQGYEDCPAFSNWFEAFSALRKLVSWSDQKKKVIFLDEIAWMDNKQSEFLPAFEGFWNEWASARDDILLIICASATSWIMKKVFHNRGGLYNRLTEKILLSEFTLGECEEFVKNSHLGYSRPQILQLYMAIGGVAFYWTKLEKGLSVAQNIEALFFGKKAFLKNEFAELYQSLFSSPEGYIKVVTALGTKSIGLTRSQIAEEAGLVNNTQLGTMLSELVECGMVYEYIPMGKRVNGVVYKLIDSFSLFYFRFMQNPFKNIDWTSMITTPEYYSWCGLSYERVVFLHLDQVKKKLGINGMSVSAYCWFSNNRKLEEGESGAQIDLLLDRADGIINIVDVKWSAEDKKYVMTGEDQQSLSNKRNVLVSQTGTKKGIHFTLVTVSGYVVNRYSDMIQSCVTLDDLFQK